MKKVIVILALVASTGAAVYAIDKEKGKSRKEKKEMKCCTKEMAKECSKEMKEASKREGKACCDKKSER